MKSSLFDWQHLAVFLAVALAFAYGTLLVYRKIKLFRAKPAGSSGDSGECPGCGTCEKNPKSP